MSEISPDRSAVIGTPPAGSATTEGSSAPAGPAERAPEAPMPRAVRAAPDRGVHPPLHRDISRALADLRRARLAAAGSTAPELAHDVELAEWRLNRLLERQQAGG